MAAALVETWAGPLEEGAGWVMAALVEGAAVVPEAGAEAEPEGTAPEEGATGAPVEVGRIAGTEISADLELGPAGGAEPGGPGRTEEAAGGGRGA